MGVGAGGGALLPVKVNGLLYWRLGEGVDSSNP